MRKAEMRIAEMRKAEMRKAEMRTTRINQVPRNCSYFLFSLRDEERNSSHSVIEIQIVNA